MTDPTEVPGPTPEVRLCGYREGRLRCCLAHGHICLHDLRPESDEQKAASQDYDNSALALKRIWALEQTVKSHASAIDDLCAGLSETCKSGTELEERVGALERNENCDCCEPAATDNWRQLYEAKRDEIELCHVQFDEAKVPGADSDGNDMPLADRINALIVERDEAKKATCSGDDIEFCPDAQRAIDRLGDALVVAQRERDSARRMYEKRIQELATACEHALDALTWASGSSDFCPEGKAAGGWDKLGRPAIDELNRVLNAPVRKCADCDHKKPDGCEVWPFVEGLDAANCKVFAQKAANDNAYSCGVTPGVVPAANEGRDCCANCFHASDGGRACHLHSRQSNPTDKCKSWLSYPDGSTKTIAGKVPNCD